MASKLQFGGWQFDCLNGGASGLFGFLDSVLIDGSDSWWFLGRLMVVMIGGDRILIVWLEFRISVGGEIVVVRPGEVVAWIMVLVGCFPQKEELQVAASGGLLIAWVAGAGGWWFSLVRVVFLWIFLLLLCFSSPNLFSLLYEVLWIFLIDFLDW